MKMKLYRITELADLFVDGCVRDAEGKMVFLSVYGRDGSILQMLASFTEGAAAGGLRRFTLVDPDAIERDQIVDVGNAEQLKKYTGKLPKAMLFTNLAHAWLYDPSVVQPDRTNQSGWVLSDSSVSTNQIDAIWTMVKLLSSIPLLDHWRDAILQGVPDLVTDLSQSPYPPLGRVAASRVALPKGFSEFVSRQVKDRTLVLRDEQLRLAA